MSDHRYKHAIRCYEQLIDLCDPDMSKPLEPKSEPFAGHLYRLAKQYVNSIEAQPEASREVLFKEIFANAWRRE